MDSIAHWINDIDSWIRANTVQIAFAQVATLLVIFGERINQIVHSLVKPYPFVARIAAFIALCTFGYGAMSAAATPAYARLLGTFNGLLLLGFTLASFIAIGMLAERGVRRR